MIAYLRSRCKELSTWLGVALVAAVLICAFIWVPRIWSWVGITAGSFMAGLPGPMRFVRPTYEFVCEWAARANRYDSGIEPVNLAAGAAIVKELPMSDTTTVIPAAPALLSTVEGLLTGPVGQAIEAEIVGKIIVPKLIEAVNSAAATGKITADVQKVATDTFIAIADAIGGKFSISDFAAVGEDLLQGFVDLKMSSSPVAVTVPVLPATAT